MTTCKATNWEAITPVDGDVDNVGDDFTSETSGSGLETVCEINQMAYLLSIIIIIIIVIIIY